MAADFGFVDCLGGDGVGVGGAEAAGDESLDGEAGDLGDDGVCDGVGDEGVVASESVVAGVCDADREAGGAPGAVDGDFADGDVGVRGDEGVGVADEDFGVEDVLFDGEGADGNGLGLGGGIGIFLYHRRIIAYAALMS